MFSSYITHTPVTASYASTTAAYVPSATSHMSTTAPVSHISATTPTPVSFASTTTYIPSYSSTTSSSTTPSVQKHISYNQFMQSMQNTNQQFYKVVRNDMIHYNMHYHVGMNVEKPTFDNYGNQMQSTGLSFSSLQGLVENFNLGGSIALIKLCEDALFTIDNGKYKTNKFVIVNVMTTIDFLKYMLLKNQEFVKSVLVKHPCLYFFLEQTRDMSMHLISQNAKVFRYIHEPTDEMIIPAIQKNWEVIKYISDPSSIVCLLAVNTNFEALKYIKNPSFEICKNAIEKNAMAILHIENPSMELFDIALKKDPNFFKHVEKGLNENLYCLYLQKNGMFLQHIENPTPKMYKVALQQTGLALKYIKSENRTPELCNIAIAENPLAMEFVPDMNMNMILVSHKNKCDDNSFQVLQTSPKSLNTDVSPFVFPTTSTTASTTATGTLLQTSISNGHEPFATVIPAL
ncbi:hypothetical protein BMW23_0180 [Bodo saltans virus]|uniref:DUF4116 domain-containing protein n=1 Tax=Bodo saltans virus TaxID=2024608 RepID=A0A2H4UTM7_9VIRU|nr:hypothetical protein QJ851_gp0175 [Bodo saltans virus]ATZ80238.1 hypothetical protein BMW23_0180 [Bodo saltans virus]